VTGAVEGVRAGQFHTLGDVIDLLTKEWAKSVPGIRERQKARLIGPVGLIANPHRAGPMPPCHQSFPRQMRRHVR